MIAELLYFHFWVNYPLIKSIILHILKVLRIKVKVYSIVLKNNSSGCLALILLLPLLCMLYFTSEYVQGC